MLTKTYYQTLVIFIYFFTIDICYHCTQNISVKLKINFKFLILVLEAWKNIFLLKSTFR